MADCILLFIKYYLFLVAAFIFFYALGHLCLKTVSGYISFEGFYTNIFFKSLTGLSVPVIIYSLAITSFKTVTLGFILLGAFLIWEVHSFKKKYQKKLFLPVYTGNALLSEGSTIWKRLYPLIFVSLLIFTWFAVIILRAENFSFSLPPCDTVFYADISKMIDISGQENTYGMSNLINKNFHGLVPYHYFELWLNALFSGVFNSVHLVSLFLFTYPVLNFITLLGIYSIIEKITKISFIHQLCAILFLFMSGLYFNNETPSTDFTLNMAESPMECYGEKFSMYYPFIICSFSFFMEGYFSIALIALLVLPLLSISTAPGILGGLFIFFLSAAIFKRPERQILSRSIFYILSLTTFILVVYSCCGNLSMGHTFTNNLLSYTDMSAIDFHSVKIFVVELFYRIKNSLLHLLLLYAPFIALAAWMLFKKKLRFNSGYLFFMIVCICITSLLFYQSFYKMRDSWQFYTNNLTLFNMLIIVTLLIILFEKSGKIIQNNSVKKIIFVFVMTLLASKAFNAFHVFNNRKKADNNLYSASYLTEIQKLQLNNKEKLRGALIYNAARFYPVESAVQANLAPYLSFVPKFLPCFYLGGFENFIPGNPNKVAGSENNNAEFSIFYQFMESQKKENTFVNLEQSQSDFIEKYEIKYLVVAENIALSKRISEKADKIIMDSKSKQKFILLK